MPPGPFVSTRVSPLEEGLGYRKPIFAGVAVVIAAAIAVGAFIATLDSDGTGVPGRAGLALWLGLGAFGLVFQSVLLWRARKGRRAWRWERGFGKSHHPGRDLVGAVATQPLIFALFGSMAAWDEAWVLIPVAVVAYAQLAIAWIYVPKALRDMAPSA